MNKQMKKFYVCSNDKDIKEIQGNSTMVFWKICDKSFARCRAVQYFLRQPVRYNSASDFSDMKYLFNFSVTVSIDDIRRHVQKAHEICKNCNTR